MKEEKLMAWMNVSAAHSPNSELNKITTCYFDSSCLKLKRNNFLTNKPMRRGAEKHREHSKAHLV